MKGFYRYLPPFAPDYSGAVSALYHAGGLTVLCDPGGCSGNVAGYDEPRFYGGSAACYSAAIREMDTIFGRDDRLEEKIISAAALGRYDFIALIGTPVVSVIGTDLNAVAKRVERATGIPAFAVPTTGMDDYSVGERLATSALLGRFCAGNVNKSGDKIGILGAIPLNAAGGDNLVSLMQSDETIFLSEAGTVSALQNMGQFRKLICLSAAAAEACARFQLPFEMDYPESPSLRKAAAEAGRAESILILHQQAVGNRLRQLLRRTNQQARIAVGSFFVQRRQNGEAQDLQFAGEDELTQAAAEYDCILGDSMYRRALGQAASRLVVLPHTALSGE